MAAEYKRKYTTKKIMEMTNLDRLQKEAAAKAQELLKESSLPAKKQEPPVVPAPAEEEIPVASQAPQVPVATAVEAPSPFTAPSHITHPSPHDETVMEDDDEVDDEEPERAGFFSGFSLFILLFPTLYLMLVFSLPETWTNSLKSDLNELILYCSYMVLTFFGVPAQVHGRELIGDRFHVLMGGDAIGFYSVVLLAAFALMFVAVQRTTAVRKWILFLSFVPLALFANVTRIVLTVGLAFNFGVQSADRYLNGFLQILVYLITIAGLFVFAVLLRKEDQEP